MKMVEKKKQQPLIERQYDTYFTPRTTSRDNEDSSLQQPLQSEVVDSVTTYGVSEPPVTFDK